MPSDSHNKHEEYRNKLLGLGNSSLRKNYYPELRRHMKELEESRLRYKAIFNATADGLFIHDAKTLKILDVNDRVCHMFGYTEEEIKSIDFEEICSSETPYTINDAANHVRITLNSGIHSFEWKCRRKDGSLFWADIILSVVDIEYRKCVIASVRDTSAKRLLEEQLLHSQKMDAMGQLAGGVAHDFNNMLAGIIGAAEIINSTADNEKIKVMSEMILKAAETAGNLTTQLLSFSHKGTFKQHPIHIHQAIHNATAILKRSLAKNIELNLELIAKDDVIDGDLSLIENVLLNMSINARDAMPDGGVLTIATDNCLPEKNKSTDVPNETLESCICITVSDTGCGIPQEICNHIFEPFYTTKESGKGTGLGLAAVYGAVQRHKGVINVESCVDRGSTFRIFLPLAEEKSAPDTVDNCVGVHGVGKILLVDDEEILRHVGKDMLIALGYDVMTAKDGLDGIEKFKIYTPDLVLLDMVMPVMSGKECFHNLKKLEPNIAVIAMSGYAPDSTINDLLSNGLAGFIKKPFKINTLSNEIAAVLSSSN